MKKRAFALFAMVTAPACAFATLVLSVLPVVTPAPAFAQTAKPPIKIGFITVLTGGLAAAGKEMEEGFRLALDEVRGEVAGRKIQLLVEDSEAKPDVGLTKTRKLVESDRVHMLAGVLHSGVSLAVGSYAVTKEVPLVVTNAIAKALTQEKRSPYVFRTSWAGGPGVLPLRLLCGGEAGLQAARRFLC